LNECYNVFFEEIKRILAAQKLQSPAMIEIIEKYEQMSAVGEETITLNPT
jgi:hypothetical protein